MKPVIKIGTLLAPFPFLLMGLVSPVWGDAENPGDYLHTRTYFGVVGTSVSVSNSGIFSGLNYSRVNNPYEVDLLPALSQSFGYGILFGHREEVWALEASFWQSNHNATFGPGVVNSVSGESVTFTQQFKDTAVYYSINVDFKRYFLTETQYQPFLSLGVSFPWIVVQNAASDANGDMGPLTLAGLGLNLGIGMEYYLSPEISFFGVAYQRWASFDEFKGVGLQYNQLAQYGSPTSDAGGGVNFALGTSFGFE